MCVAPPHDVYNRCYHACNLEIDAQPMLKDRQQPPVRECYRTGRALKAAKSAVSVIEGKDTKESPNSHASDLTI